MPLSEKDLYLPVKEYLVSNGYAVRGEVHHCDLTATRDEDLVIIELKKSLNLTLLIQATQRQKITDSVYVAVPKPSSGLNHKEWRKIEHLIKRLELGLILVDFGKEIPQVSIRFHPVPLDRKKIKKKRRSLIQEMHGRSEDYNIGGTAGIKQITAYREESIFIACILEEFGEMTPAQLKKMGTGKKTQSILYNNHYGWFERTGRGLYAIKPGAMREIEKFASALAFCQKKMLQLKQKEG